MSELSSNVSEVRVAAAALPPQVSYFDAAWSPRDSLCYIVAAEIIHELCLVAYVLGKSISFCSVFVILEVKGFLIIGSYVLLFFLV